MEKGDLVWLPAATSLLKLGEDGCATEHKTTEHPTNVFLVEKRDEVYWKILHEGEQWYVPQNLLYANIGD